MITTEKLLDQVQTLIDSNKYTKISGRCVGKQDQSYRCWLGLALKILETEGLVQLSPTHWYKPTTTGLAAVPNLKEALHQLDFSAFGIPGLVEQPDGSKTALWELNDHTDSTFQDIQDAVLQAVTKQQHT